MISTSGMEMWLSEQWPKVSDRFSPSEIFSTGEIALLLRMLPNKTLHLESCARHSGKNSRVHILVLLAANMDWPRIQQSFVVGKRRSLHCFKNVKGLLVWSASKKKA